MDFFVIENYLLTSNLVDSINYIVTTKGIPLKISRGNCATTMQCSTVDTELSVLLSNYQSSDNNPYYQENLHFARSQFGIYLVTRLDAFSQDDIFNLIDKSGPNSLVNKNSAISVLDINQTQNQNADAFFIWKNSEIANELTINDWNYLSDTNFTMVQNTTNVLFYNEQHYTVSNANPNFSWTNGSFGEVVNSYSAKTFDVNGDVTGQLLLAELISEGAASAHGYCYPTFYNNTLYSSNFIKNYLDTSLHFNLAESIYSSEVKLVRQSVTIGDPKTTIKIDNTLNLAKNENTIFRVFPNPSAEILTIISEKKIDEINMIDLNGKQLTVKTNYINNYVQINLNELEQGSYILNLKINGENYFEKITKTH
jgi:uncharacterized protein (TIGR03790 family)